jgi:hypothetical protein
MNPLNRDFFMVYLPLLTCGWYAGWFARGWWEARASRLEAALLKYGSHKVSCELYYEAGGRCNCGFDAALSGEGEK